MNKIIELHRNNKFLAKGTFLVIATVLSNFLNFLFNAYLGRAIPIEEFALISVIGSIFALTDIPVGALGKTVTYKSAHFLGKHNIPAVSFWRYLRKRAIIFAIFISLLWITASVSIARFFQIDSVIPILSLTPLWLTTIISSVDWGYIGGNLKFGYLAIVSMVEALTKLLLVILLIKIGLDQFAYLSIVLSSFVSFIFIVYGASRLKKFGVTIKKKVAKEKFPFRYYFSSVMTKVSTVCYLSFDVILAKHFLPPQEAGQYALLSLTGKMVYLAGSFFSQFIIPIVSHQEGTGTNSKNLFNKLLLATFASSFMAFLIIGLFGYITVPFLFGKHSYPILGLIPLYALSMVAFTIASNIVSFHQIKSNQLLPFISFILAIVEIVAISIFHHSMASISYVMVILGFVSLFIAVLFHLLRNQILTIVLNFKDLFGLFKPLGNNQETVRGLRILIFNWRDRHHTWAGGAEEYIHEISKRWVKNGNQVTLFCGNDRKNPVNQKIDGITIIRRGGFYTVYIWAFLYYIFKFRRKYDIIVDSENGIPFFSPLYSARPVVLLIHHVHQEIFIEHMKFPLSYIAKFVEGKIMPFVYRKRPIITVSESSKAEIIKFGFANESDIQIVNPGINEMGVLSKKTKYPTFIYLGRLKPYKNIDKAIVAFKKVLEVIPRSVFYIVGEGEQEDALKKLVINLNLTKKVLLLGKVDEKTKYNLLSRSWVALQPSQMEGWGITVIEANSCATPVIASDTKGLRDSIVHNKTGILVKIGDSNMLARQMIELSLNTNKRLLLSQNAINWSKNFSWDLSSERFFANLTDVIAKRKALHSNQGIGYIFNRVTSIF